MAFFYILDENSLKYFGHVVAASQVLEGLDIFILSYNKDKVYMYDEWNEKVIDVHSMAKQFTCDFLLVLMYNWCSPTH